MLHKTSPFLALLLLGPLALATAPAAFGYGYKTCDGNPIEWSSSPTMYLSTTSFPAGSSWDSRLQNAMWHWNNVKGSSFKFYVGRDTDGSHSNTNKRNEVYMESHSGGTLAVTHRRYTCSRFIETDIGFDSSNRTWSTGTYSYSNPNGSPYNFESVALHELGHALGLNHENRRMATMNSYYPNSGPLGYSKEWDPFGDDRKGARFLYPDSTTETDIAASPLKRTGSGTSGLVSSPSSAARGSSVTIQYTFTNLGTSKKTFDNRFYLSTNRVISSADRVLGTNTGASASAGATLTFSRTLTIPSSVAPGTYWIGFVVDYNNKLSEANESNNAQPMPRSITIY